MKTLIIYYSYTGKTKKLAQHLADKEQTDMIELKDQKRPSTIGAYVAGSLSARRQKQAKLQPFKADFSAYEKIIVAMPVWAGFPAPAFNNIVALLPSGKQVEIIMTSGGGDSGDTQKRVRAMLSEKGCTLAGFQDVKASEIG
ncbi:NAD(P)H-dependent oxidoreductase [Oscillospiraceae bacterium OttesenSCG-928-F05]|nr:NAD(P)H-dependent oxidoreductase [Oscillospiraceae bacterium OttesenSCG-928-F05]